MTVENPRYGPERTLAGEQSADTSSAVGWHAIPALVKLLFFADLALGVAYLLDHLLGQPFWISTRLVDLDLEGNIPAWYSSMQLAMLAVAFGLLSAARIACGSRGAYGLLLLPLICLGLSCDEIAQVHEWFGHKTDALLPEGQREDTAFEKTGIWMFLAGPFLFALLLVARKRLAPLLAGQRQATRIYFAGVSLYLASALGLEALSNAADPGGVASILVVAAEEIGEMLGITLTLWATLILLRTEDVHIRVGERRLALATTDQGRPKQGAIGTR